MAVRSVNRWATNAEMTNTMFTEFLPAAGLWLPDDPVLDVTFHEGKWWTEFAPPVFKYMSRLDDPTWDFRVMPFDNDQFGTIAYDPPYSAQGGRDTSTVKEMLSRYGQDTSPERPLDLIGMNIAGLMECCRAAERAILMKSMDFVTGGEVFPQTRHLEDVARVVGWEVYERFVHEPVGGRPQPSGRRELHAQRRPSILSVLVPYKHRKGIRKRMVDPDDLPVKAGAI